MRTSSKPISNLVSPKKQLTRKKGLLEKKKTGDNEEVNTWKSFQAKNKSKSKAQKPKLTKEVFDQLANFGIKSTNSYTLFEDKVSIYDFVNILREQQFQDCQKLKMKLLDYVISQRIVRDKQFECLYDNMTQRFPNRQMQVKQILVEILAALDE